MNNKGPQEDDILSSPSEAKNVFSFMMMSQQSIISTSNKKENKGSSDNNSNRKRPRNHQSAAAAAAVYHSKTSIPSQSSRFLPCPYCSKSISSAFIQVHVDKCSSNAEYQHQENLRQERKKAKIFHKHRASGNSNGVNNNTVVTPDKNAFTKMMDNSKQWNFGENNKSEDNNNNNLNRKAKRQQWFHLTKDMEVIWIADERSGQTNNNDGDEESTINNRLHQNKLCGDEIHWSSSILIHASKIHETNLDNIELNVTSSIPPCSSPQASPFVQSHSRLSIPVLKSILQKSVRRRRPLPSVKVAMELADKALGELLRRLPIICIEDSTLHHDFPFLIWIMVAQSKQFQPTKPMMTRVFQAVFEISSCPWRDNLGIPKVYEDDREEPKEMSLTAMTNPIEKEQRDENSTITTESTNNRQSQANNCDLMIRSILLRQKYGGMGGDLRMLQRYARVWQCRFADEKVMHQQLAKACLPKHCCDDPGNGTSKPIFWSHVPKLLHPVERSSKSIIPLMVRPLPYLKYADVTPAGVDFHCSNVLDIPLYNLNIQSQIRELYYGNADESSKKLSVQDIGGLMKRACWDYCSGVNYRRAFRQALEPNSLASTSVTKDEEENDRMKQVWDLISPSVETFAKNHLTQRMVAPR